MTRPIAALLLLLFVTGQLQAQDPPVKLDNGNTIQLCGACPSRTVRLAVTAAKFTVASGEKPEVLEVSSGNVRNKDWKEWITASWETAKTGVPVALDLQVDDRLNRAGTYDVVLMLRPNLPRLKLQIVQAAAQLDVPDKLVIERTQIFPGWCCSDPLPPLSVRESTGMSKVAGMQFFPKQPVAGTSSVSGFLSLTEPNAEIAAGQPKDIGYQLKGEFPRGIAAGSLKIVAPQLAQPVTLNYEIRTKLHPLWVLIAIAAGLALGYIVRNVLQDRIELTRAQQQADEIAGLVSDHLADYDQSVEKEIHAELIDLRRIAKGSKAADIVTAADKLRAKWKTALETFEQRHKKAAQLVRDLDEVLRLPWVVPSEVRKSLTDARVSVKEASVLLDHHKADEATETVDAAYKTLAQEIRDKGLAWQTAAQGLAGTLADPAISAGIPDVVRSQFASVLKNAPPELGRIKNDALKPEIPVLKQALDDLSTELRGYSEVLLQFKLRGQAEWAQFEAAWIGAKNIPDRAALDNLKLEFAQVLSDVAAAAADPAALRDTLPKRLAGLQKSWKKAVESQIPSGNPNMTNLLQMVDDRKFTDAGIKMAAILNNVQIKWGDADEPTSGAWPSASLAASTSHFVTLFGMPDSRRGAVTGLPRIALEHRLKSAQILQTVIVGALMGLWAFSSYVKDFDGTFSGLLAPLFATLLLDISIEGLKGQMKAKAGGSSIASGV